MWLIREFIIVTFTRLHVLNFLLTQVIEMRRLAAEHRVQSLLKELEEEITELKKRSTALSQLALSEDYVHFFKVWMDEWLNTDKLLRVFEILFACSIPI